MDERIPTSQNERYELRDLLGRGGMAIVHAAFDRSRSKVVALKRLSFERFSVGPQRERAMALFEREYYALSQLAHPCVVQVYDYGIDAQGPYYTMELLSGESLRARGVLPWVEACSLVRDIASALALLHSRSLIHRDVTPLNIYCAPDGCAKLIDFGAMIPAGVAPHLVGTPAFTAPEAVHQQSLDGRADLFALGGCLYFALTGQYAYPARRMDSLYEVWQTPPQPVIELAADVPPALDELVRALLSLERDDRPRTAAEVCERLTTIAGLQRDDAAAMAQSYLTRPALVGRKPEIAALRERAQATVTGAGSAIVMRAAPGLGRSYMLDAAALEATLCGLRVARADATARHTGSLGVARRLLGALVDSNAPVRASLEASGLGTLVRDGLPAGLDGDKREATLDALTRAFFEGCKHEPIALIVDDAQAADESSLALLAGLAALAQNHRLLIVCSLNRDVKLEPGSAGALLSHSARRLDLGPLNAEQSRELLASLFDDVLNIDVLAAISYQRCRGNPRMLLEAAQRLIEQGLAKYESGSWLIANAPEALAAAIDDHADLEQRFRSLSADAAELLEVVAFDSHAILNLASYPLLLQHDDSARMHRALSELVETHWVELSEDQVQLMHEDRRRSIAERISSARSHKLHALFAQRCIDLGLPAVFEAHHRLGAGEHTRAVAALDAFTLFVDANPTAEVLRHPVTLVTTEAVSLLQDVPAARATFQAKYFAAAVLNGTYRTLAEFTAARLPRALAALAPFTGSQDYAKLGELPPAERLSQSLTAAAARCSETGLGAMDLLSALRRQTQLCVTAGVIANFMSDAQLVAALPDLTPFRVLSPALDAAAQALDALTKLVRGQTWAAWDTLNAARDVLNGAAAEQIDGFTRMVLNRVVLGYLSQLNADFGTSAAPEMIIEYALTMPDSAASFRTRCCMAHADLAAAAESRRHFEVLSVRTGALANARIIELTSHLTTYALCDDAIGLRRTHRALQEAAKARPGWQPRVELAQVRLLQCRGARHEALRVVEALLARLVLPHADWQFAAATQLELLVAEKRSPEAVERGREYLARAHAAQLPDYHIAWTLARACLVQGAHDEAEQHYAHAIAQLEARGAQGILPGCAYEVGARIASARGDVAAFETRVEACASHFRPGKHPGLTARYNALRRDGSREGRWGKDGSASGVNSEATLSDSRLESLLQAAADSPDDATFYQGILQRLLDGAAAVGGVLYVNDAGRLVRVAMAGAVAARPELDAAVARSCALDEESVTATESKPPAQAPGLTTDSGAIEICVLDGREGGAPIVEGALVLEHATRDRPVRVHAWLKGVALAVATRSRARSVFGSGTQSLTALHQRPNTEHSNTEGNDPDTTSTTEPAAG